MANEFHRLTPPVAGDYVRNGWAGLIPDPGYVDWMNNDPAAPATQAPANGPLFMVGNPYNGTFFVGGKEDAADVFANRAHAALAQNIDQIDSAIRRGVATIQKHVWAGGAITFTFPPGTVVWVGSATPGNEVEIIDRVDGSSLVTTIGTKLIAVAWTIGPIDAAGFAIITDVTFNEAVPLSPGGYYVFIGTKSGLAELPRDAMFTEVLHGISQVPVKVQLLFQRLHAPVGSIWQQSWDDPWGTTIEELSRGGLNERYNRSHTADGLHLGDDYAVLQGADYGWISPVTPDVSGAGGWILRNGMAPASVSRRSPITPLETDKINACWRAVMVDHPATGGGSSGFVVHGGRTSTESTKERGPGLFSFAHLKANRQSTADWYGVAGWTVIPDGGAADVGYEVIDGVTELVLHLDALGTAHFWKFYNAPPLIPLGNYSYVVTGFDTIEVVDPADGTAKHWVIYRMDPADDQKCVLRSTSGKTAPVGKPSGGYANGVSTPVTCTWNSVLWGASDGAAEKQLQLRKQVNEYLPGAYPLPCPLNYGFNVLGGPVPNLVSHYGAGELQMFDQAVMSLYATSPTGSPVLQWGTKQIIIDGFGQTPPTAYGSLLSNGNLMSPVLFTSAIRPFNFGGADPADITKTLPLVIEANVLLVSPDGKNMLQATQLRGASAATGLTLHQDPTDNTKMLMRMDFDHLYFGYSADAAKVILCDTANRGFKFSNELGEKFRRIENLVTIKVGVDVAAPTIVVVDPTVTNRIIIDSWTGIALNASLEISIDDSVVYAAGVSGTSANGFGGRAFRFHVGFDPAVAALPSRIVNVRFTKSAGPDPVIHTIKSFNMETDPAIPMSEYLIFELFVIPVHDAGSDTVCVSAAEVHRFDNYL